MTVHTLTYAQHALLQRYFDGELVQGTSEHRLATEMITHLTRAQDMVASLEELALAVRCAEQSAWEKVQVPAPGQMADHAMTAQPSPTFASVAPILERKHDLELAPVEVDDIEGLMLENVEAGSYMSELEFLRYSAQESQEHMLADVDFSGFFDSIESRLDASHSGSNVLAFPGKVTTDERPTFNLEEHQLRLARFFDHEVDAQEEAEVRAWAEIDPAVAETLDVFAELSLATKAAVDELGEQVNFSSLWGNIESALQADDAPANVTSLEDARRARQQKKSSGLGQYKREAFIAIAAAIFAVFGYGLLSENVIKPAQTIVIVESLDYQNGSSGMLMQPASMELGEDQEPSSGQEEEPTIIWILEDEDPQDSDVKPQDRQDQPI